MDITFRQSWIAVRFLLVMTLVLGVGYPVAVAVGIFTRIDEEAFFDGCKVAANFQHLFKEGHGPLFQVAHHRCALQ